jgi:hypothetical protein
MCSPFPTEKSGKAMDVVEEYLYERLETEIITRRQGYE